MLKFSFFHPLGYLGLEIATQRMPLLRAQCWAEPQGNPAVGFNIDLWMN